MLRVNLSFWGDDPEQEHPDVLVWFTFTEGDDAVEIHVVEGVDFHWLSNLRKYGIVGRKMKKFTLADGKEFLEELRFEYHGSKVFASWPFEV